MSKIQLSENFIKNTVKLALNEDLYPSGDITSNLVKNNKVIQVKLLSNQKHYQHSGVCIFKNNESIWEYSETVELKMHDLTDKEIINYVEMENPIHAAGAYKFESLGCNLFSYVDGSSHTVRGMPLIPLLNALRKLKIIGLE